MFGSEFDLDIRIAILHQIQSSLPRLSACKFSLQWGVVSGRVFKCHSDTHNYQYCESFNHF